VKHVLGFLVVMLCCQSISWGYETAPRISDREIVERLTKLEEGQKAILREIDKRFESMDKRFESIDKRFESIDKRFDQLINIMVAVICAFAGIVAVTIGFAIWDRRTMIRPFEIKVRMIEGRLDVVESESKNFDQDKLNRLIEAMKKLASGNQEIAEALRSFKLL
jgi:hypothetical protein